jgi:NitT/TauT family transport system substrate-binding protein
MNRLAALRLGSAGLVAPLIGASPRPGIPLRVGATNDEDFAEAFYAADLGYYADAGFDATVTMLATGSAVVNAVLGGALDVGIGNLASISAAHVRGLPIALLAPCAVFTRGLTTHAVLVAPASPIHSAADLAGRTVGLTSLNSLLHIAVKTWIDKTGGDASAVKYVEIPLSEMVVALQSGRIDAVGITEPWVSRAKTQTRILGKPFESVGNNFLITGWIATKSWAEANRSSVERLAAVVRRTAIWTNANPRPSAAILSRYVAVDADVIEHMNRTRMGTTLDAASIQPVIDAAARYNVLPKAFPAAELLPA